MVRTSLEASLCTPTIVSEDGLHRSSSYVSCVPIQGENMRADPIPSGAIPIGHTFGADLIPFGRFAVDGARLDRSTVDVDYLAAWGWRREWLEANPDSHEAGRIRW